MVVECPVGCRWNRWSDHRGARTLEAELEAYALLRNAEVGKRLGIDPAEASELALALATDADLAPALASDLLAKHAGAIEERERFELNSTAEPGYVDGQSVIFYEISEGMRQCMKLLNALRMIAGTASSSSRAA